MTKRISTLSARGGEQILTWEEELRVYGTKEKSVSNFAFFVGSNIAPFLNNNLRRRCACEPLIRRSPSQHKPKRETRKATSDEQRKAAETRNLTTITTAPPPQRRTPFYFPFSILPRQPNVPNNRLLPSLCILARPMKPTTTINPTPAPVMV